MSEIVERKRSEKRQRTDQVKVRLTPQEKAHLEAGAAAAGMEVAAFVRHQTLGRKGPRTRRLITGDLAELARLRGELGHVGGNLNQLTRLANIGDLDRPVALDRALEAVIETVERIDVTLAGGA